MDGRPRVLVLSHVHPYPPVSGQQQRVFNKLRAFHEQFHVTLATLRPTGNSEVPEPLQAWTDEVVYVPRKYGAGRLSRAWHRFVGELHARIRGVKFSNYRIGRLEFTPERLSELPALETFDCVVLEYWHAAESMALFRDRGIPCVLDMHDVLWQSYEQQLQARRVPDWWRRWSVARYRSREEDAWRRFDALIAINRGEKEYVEGRLPSAARVFYAPMGTDLERWPYSWDAVQPPRVAFYGSMASRQNQMGALRCVHEVMPRVWEHHPEVELWIVGSGPPPSIQSLAKDIRIRVTGYVPDVAQVLRTMTALVCPWTGTYGFRSRLIEAMALGVPVVASPDAVHGMGLEVGCGVLLGETDHRLADHVVDLLRDSELTKRQSRSARQEVEAHFSFEQTYGRLSAELAEWIRGRREEKHHGNGAGT